MVSIVIANILGWIYAHKGTVAIIVLSVLLFAFGVLLFKGCGKPQPKLDQAEVIKAQEIIANGDRKEMEQWKANVAANVAAIDANVADAKNLAVNAAAESRKDSAGKTNEELAAEIEQMLRDSQ